MKLLISKSQLAEAMNVSERTIDRWRARGYDLGEVRTPGLPRFDLAKVEAAVQAGAIHKRKKK